MKALHERLMWVFTIKRNGCYQLIVGSLKVRQYTSPEMMEWGGYGMASGPWKLVLVSSLQEIQRLKQPLRQYHKEVDRQVFLHDDWLNFFNNQWHWEGEGIRSISTSYNVCTLFISWFEQTNCEKTLLSYWKQLKMDWMSILKPRNCHYYQFCLMGC